VEGDAHADTWDQGGVEDSIGGDGDEEEDQRGGAEEEGLDVGATGGDGEERTEEEILWGC
jgi:hypothetical protein